MEEVINYIINILTSKFPFFRLTQKYLDQRAKILKKYPLPNGKYVGIMAKFFLLRFFFFLNCCFVGWKEVYDPGCTRHYYWCPRTDEVSWLPPRHPLAVIGDAAPKVAKGLVLIQFNLTLFGSI